MKYFLGVDGGATKTEAVVIDEQGNKVAEALSGPLNYHQGGAEEVSCNLKEVINKVLVQAQLKIENISFAVLGTAGFDTEEDKKVLKELVPKCFGKDLAGKIKVISDVEIAFSSGITQDFGIVLIAGTGANCFGKGKNGELAWAGDWGYLLGDQGSGFALGLGALKRIMREFDGRGVPTTLTGLIIEKLSLDSPFDLVSFTYQAPVPVKEIAGLAPLVFSASEQGDKVAADLVNKLIVEMVLSVQAVARKTGLINEEFELALVGGIFKENLVIKLLEREIKKILPKAKVVLPKVEPAAAAALMARGYSL